MAYSTSEVDYLKQCTSCGKLGHSADSGRISLKVAEKPPEEKRSGLHCSHCKRKGHVEKDCWSKHGRSGSAATDDAKKTAAVAPSTQKASPGNSSAGSRTCFRCHKEGHMARNCPDATAPVSLVQRGSGGDTPFYNIPITRSVDFRAPVGETWSRHLSGVLRGIDTKEVVLGPDDLPLPLHYTLQQSYVEKEVFEVDKVPTSEKPVQVGCLRSLSSTVKGQQLLTVWDTGAAVAVVPRSTIEQTGTDWIPQPDIDFVMADGARHMPLGFAPKFVFRIGDLFFVLKVYIVEGANYQLLLGNSFIYDVGAAILPMWRRVILTIPVRLKLHASLNPIRRDTCSPLQDEAQAAKVVVHRLLDPSTVIRGKEVRRFGSPHVQEVQDDDIVELNDPVTVTYVGVLDSASVVNMSVTPMLQIYDVASAYRLGMKDLVHEVESHMVPEVIDRSLPVLTKEFVASSIEFADTVPPEVRDAVCLDIIDYSHAFSWNAFDLGCITDVPHRVVRVDDSPAIHPSRRHLYTPHNEAILHSKCDPYIDMGIFQPASSLCKDRTQLTIVRTAVVALGQDRNDPKYCRIAYDFRAINDRVQLDPEPVDSVPDMLAWMGVGPTGLFFKIDADRGFYQIVCAADDGGESINSTCFELFHRLWVSTRLLFGQKNGPATFKRNAVIMQEELLGWQTKSYFDDIIGKAGVSADVDGNVYGRGSVPDFAGLRQTWWRLLELAARHGWKFKPAKTKWGFSTIETVGFEWSPHGIAVGQKIANAVKNLTFPRSKSELRGLLGLANQFRERIAGYALMVTALTALTRGLERKVFPTPEALIEFENLKVVLNSPPVLQQFRYDRRTFVYTDASIGSRSPNGGTDDDGLEVPGGLGVVIVQTDDEGHDYVCAYASAGLTPAQKNYNIVRLELLAFVFACGKFYDWLAGIPFIWRSDCRAHEFLHTAQTSTNPTITR